MRDFYEYIEDYLKGNLSKADKKEFESYMSKDSKLSEAVEQHGIVEEVLELMIEDDIRNVINKIDSERNKMIPVFRISSLKLIYRIAAVALILVASYIVVDYYISNQFDHDMVIAKYYAPPDHSGNTRSGDIEETILEKGMYFFDLGMLGESAELFNIVLRSDIDSNEVSTANFYLGIIAYLEHSFDEAILYFSKSSDFRKFDYLGQIYYIQGDMKSLGKVYRSNKSSTLKQLLEDTKSWKYRWAK